MKCCSCGSKKLARKVDKRGHPYFTCSCGASTTPGITTSDFPLEKNRNPAWRAPGGGPPFIGGPSGSVLRAAGAARKAKAGELPPE